MVINTPLQLLPMPVVKGAVADFSFVFQKRQVTFGYVAGIIGATRDELRCRKATCALLENVVESKEAWLRWRIIMAYQQRPASDAPFSLVDVKRALTIHDATYEEHQKLIEQIIKELNGCE